MVVRTSRFGLVEVDDDEILTFQEGILGFDQLRQFVLLDDPDNEIFVWLQSCENPAVAFPVLEPELFIPDYQVRLTRSDAEAIGGKDQNHLRVFTIVTIPADPTQMTANLKAPVVINNQTHLARQCVLQDNQLAIREPIFARLQQRVVKGGAIADNAVRSDVSPVKSSADLPINEVEQGVPRNSQDGDIHT